LESELNDVLKSIKKSDMDLNKVEEEGFVKVYNAIDDLLTTKKKAKVLLSYR